MGKRSWEERGAWAAKMREYYHAHPEYAARVRAAAKARHRRMMENPEWRERERARCRAKERTARDRRKAPDPVKRRARYLVSNAVRDGRLTKPKACPDCGGVKERITAHHEDYSNPLAVEWLCTLCHGRRHRSIA